MSRAAPAKSLRLAARGSQRGSVIRGATAAHAFIDAVNLSASAALSAGYHDTVTIAQADARGEFAAKLPMRRGDVVRVRARGARGKLGPWLLLTARGIGGAPRKPQVALFRFGLAARSRGMIHVFNLSLARPIAAPGTEIVLENERTSAHVIVRINDKSTIARGTRIAGDPGDTLVVRVGKHVIGKLVTPPRTSQLRGTQNLVSPWGYHQKHKFVPELRLFHTPLFWSTRLAAPT